MNIKYLYRISDAGRSKLKLEAASKMNCLANFIDEFKENILVFADNCSDETIQEIQKKGIEPIKTSLGNAASWRYVVEYAIGNFDENDYVYLIEDDYLHLPGSLLALKEGLAISDYVTLYDHPDKYKNHDESGPNPYVIGGGERTVVLVTKNLHWKHTNSTTMSFAARVKTLKEDKKVWWYCTQDKLPNDFLAFQLLTRQRLLFTKTFYKRSVMLLFLRPMVKKRRTLICPIPGLATHAELEWLTPLTMFHQQTSWERI